MRYQHLLGYLASSMAIGAVAGPVDVLEPRDLIGDHEFDYVVVGGGTAGIVIATRLAQQPFSVALVEAGGIYQLQSFQAIPAADFLPVGADPDTKSPVDWGFVTENLPGANGRAVHYARGKCLGGSSALNFMIYQRPSKESMQQWANTVNDSSYTFDNLLPYYKKSVELTPPNEDTRFDNATAEFDPTAFDDQGGPLHVSYANYAMSFSTWMKLGMEAIGIEEQKDFNLGTIMGAQYCSSTIRPSDQTRSSSQSSFLESIKPASRKVYSNTLAKKVLFDDNKKATGVHVQGTLATFTLTAKKEVILSAGAFQSPQLLMVSGIGPAETLQEHNIDPVVELPGVGQNMWDHPFIAPAYRVNVQTLTQIASNFISLLTQFLNKAIQHTGPLTNPISDYLAWEKIPESLRSRFSGSTADDLKQFPDDWPEAEYISGAGYIGNASNLLRDQPRDGYQYASMLGVLVAPLSRGNVTLQSADMSDPPIINPNWLDRKTDQEMAIAMFKRIRQAFESDAMAPIVIGEEYYPGEQVQSDEEMLEYIKDNVMTLWHASSTCKMGTSDDPMAVVDHEAKVFGIQGLRVVDASAFPFLPPGHPQSTVYMLAEKISDLIVNSAKQ